MANRFLIPIVALLLFPVGAAAQSRAGAANLQIPPDVRAEGMGRVWAPLDTGPYAAWGNVGGLGLAEGFHVVKMNTQLVPDLAEDVRLEYFSMVVGYKIPNLATVPLNFSFGFNRTDLGYGESILTDEGSPDIIGTFEAYEDTRGFTFAAGYADLVGVGVGIKKTTVNLGPDSDPGSPGHGEANAVDYGVLARSPYLVLGGSGTNTVSLRRKPTGDISLRAVGAMAWSNRGKGISLGSDMGTDPLPELRRESIGLEVRALPLLDHLHTQNKILKRLFRDTHLLTVSVGIGRQDGLLDQAYPDSIAATLSKNELEDIVTYDGYEIRLFDIFSYRRGTIFDDPGEVKGSTDGWGVSLFGYLGLDYAEIPQFRELERVEKWSFWFRVPLDWL